MINPYGELQAGPGETQDFDQAKSTQQYPGKQCEPITVLYTTPEPTLAEQK